MNGVNLEAFPFEYDLTWMSFFQNGEGRTYARYGGREDTGPESHLNQASLLRTMHRVLELHRDGAVQKDSRYEPVAKSTTLPSDLPPMKEMIGKRKESCIHCHDVKVAKLRVHHNQGTIRKDMVFTYPSPSQIGLEIDTEQHDLIAAVRADSAAAKAGILPNDRLIESDGQRLTTFADFTRVLELTDDSGTLPLTISRAGKKLQKQVELEPGWRNSPDPSWRASLHVVGPGAGFWGRTANSKEREQLKLREEDLALKVTFIWAPHAKAAELKLGDYVVDLDGQKGEMNMRQFHGYLQMHRQWGDTIQLQVIRDGAPTSLTMTLPKQPAFD